MSLDSYCKATELLTPAYNALEELNKENRLNETFSQEWLNGPIQSPDKVYNVFKGSEDDLWRSIEAEIDHETCELAVNCYTWKDYSIEGRENEQLKLYDQKEVGRFTTETDALPDAIESAYRESLKVNEKDLKQSEIVPSGQWVHP